MNRPKVPFSDLEKQLVSLFYRVLFSPLVATLKPVSKEKLQLVNASGGDALLEALRGGRIQYADGVFSGRFSAAISGALKKIGASFDSREKVFRLPAARVPTWVVVESVGFNSRAEAAHKEVLRQLSDVERGLDVSLYERPIEFADTVAKVEDGWRQTARALELKPDIGPGALDAIRREWTDTAKLPIKTFAVEEVRALRKVVEGNASEGYRFDRLVAGIEARFDVAKNKAKFLARNETSIFMSKFRQQRFQEAGVRRYKWSTSEDSRVRPATSLSPAARAHAGNHRRLNGKVFFFDQPPIVDPNTGRRANPGEDYNCRCVAIPMLDAFDPHEMAGSPT